MSWERECHVIMDACKRIQDLRGEPFCLLELIELRYDLSQGDVVIQFDGDTDVYCFSEKMKILDALEVRK